VELVSKRCGESGRNIGFRYCIDLCLKGQNIDRNADRESHSLSDFRTGYLPNVDETLYRCTALFVKFEVQNDVCVALILLGRL
jgi:hypothetical protein